MWSRKTAKRWWYVLMGARKMSGSCSNTSRAPVLVHHGDEAHVVAAVELALLQQRTDRALHRRAQVVGVALGDQERTALAQPRQAVLEHREEEPLLGAEVVLHRRVVAVPGGRADLAQGHAVDAALREQALGGEDDLLLGRRRDHRHGPDLTTLDSQSQPT